MDRDLEEKAARKKSNEMFNSITEKQKPENQNQTHNSRRKEWDLIPNGNHVKYAAGGDGTFFRLSLAPRGTFILSKLHELSTYPQ